MDKNPFSDGRALPMDDGQLEAMLSGGPSVPQSEVVPEVPPMPQPQVSQQEVLAEPVKAESPTPNEGPDNEMKEQMILPSEAEKVILKQKYGILRVVPIPYTRDDGKIQTYILRQLTRSQWRAMETQAQKIAANKPDISVDEIFQEKIIAQAVVWPDFQEHQIAASPPGLVPTLFGVVQQMGLFFSPEAIMSVTFTL